MNVSVHGFFRALLGVLLVLGAVSEAFAGALVVEAPRWACWYSPKDLTIQCLLSQVPTGNVDRRAAEVASRINPHLPEIVRVIWGSPQEFAGERLSIPLNSIPFEMEFVAQLARSAMCGGRVDCSVMFDPNRDGHAEVRAAALEAGALESEVMAEVLAQGLALPVIESPAPRGKRRRSASLFAAVFMNESGDRM